MHTIEGNPTVLPADPCACMHPPAITITSPMPASDSNLLLDNVDECDIHP